MTDQHIQLLDDLGAEFARVAAEQERTSPRRTPPRRFRSITSRHARALAVALGVVALFAGGYTVPATRAAFEDVTSSFAGWVGGNEEQAPGQALRPDDDVPSWFAEGGGTRLIAEAEGVKLYARTMESPEGPTLDFGLGSGLGVIVGGSLDSWRDRFDEHAVVVLGPALFGRADALDQDGRFPLLGVTARSVKRVELRYAEGPPLSATTGAGDGFVLIADAWRPLRELVAYDAAGRQLDRADVSHLDMRYLCDKEPGCPSATP